MSISDSTDDSDQNSSDDPNWDLLPEKPVEFFQLDEDFDRKQLKRAYNRLLKRFKPEKHPEEFQKIRAAYENLERFLRFGEYYRSDANKAWEAATENREDDDSSPTEAIGPTNTNSSEDEQPNYKPVQEETQLNKNTFSTLASKIESGDVDLEEFYQELKLKENKEATEYYQLAILSDFVPDSEHLAFLVHLLNGLKKYPRDSGLAATTYRFLNDQVPDSSLAKVVVACSKAVRHDGFYQLTEGVWDRLIRIVPIDKFKLLLDKCEQNLDKNEHKVSGRVVFYLHMLQLAIWKDRSDWIDRKIDFVEEHFSEIPPHSEADFEVLTMTRDYLTVRNKFISNGPECKKLDHLMESFFCDDPNESDRAFLEYQFSLANDYRPLAKEISVSVESGQQEFFTLWNWIAHNVGGRLITHAEHEVDYNFWGHRMQGWFSSVLNLNPMFMQIWQLQSHAMYAAKLFVPVIASVLLFFGVITLFAIISPYDEMGPIFAIVLLMVSLLFAARFYTKWWPDYVGVKWWDPYCERKLIEFYHRLWQPACLGFLRQSQIDYFDFRGLLGQMPQLQTDTNAANISNLVHQDITLAIYALAQKFRE